jgi:hypothetical protein
VLETKIIITLHAEDRATLDQRAAVVTQYLGVEQARLGWQCTIARVTDGIVLSEHISETRYTNSYLCPHDDTRWDHEARHIRNIRCPNCGAHVEPYASSDNLNLTEIIHNHSIFDRANPNLPS